MMVPISSFGKGIEEAIRSLNIRVTASLRALVVLERRLILLTMVVVKIYRFGANTVEMVRNGRSSMCNQNMTESTSSSIPKQKSLRLLGNTGIVDQIAWEYWHIC